MSKLTISLSALITGVVIAVLLSISPAAHASAAVAGNLDPTFGNGGIATTRLPHPIEGYAYTTAIQPDGKIVLVGSGGPATGYWAISRLNPDGSPDTSFGMLGSVTTSWSGPAESGSVAIQPDGKIVAGGYYTPGYLDEYALARYNPDGSLDTSFGIDGKVSGPTNNGSVINALALLPDGKILVGGTRDVNPNNMWVARFNSNGSPDASFGNNGSAVTFCGVLNGNCQGFALTVQADGKPVVGGTVRYTDSNGVVIYAFALARFTPNGQIDNSFGNNGVVRTNFEDQDIVYALGHTGDGKIIAAGYACCLTDGIAVARYNSNGTLDSSFGTGGKTMIPAANIGYSMIVKGDGRIVLPATFVSPTTSGSIASPSSAPRHGFQLAPKNGSPAKGGQETASSSPAAPAAPGAPNTLQFGVVQFQSNGSLDPSFGSGGEVITSFGGDGEAAQAVALDASGRIVAFGDSFSSSTHPEYRFAVARYLANGTLDSSFGNGGKTILTPLGTFRSYSNVIAQGDKTLALGLSNYYFDSTATPSNMTYSIVRYNANGSVDPSFGTAGVANIVFSQEGWIVDMELQSNGKIVLAAYDLTGSGWPRAYHLVMIQLTADGQVDTSFGSGGRTSTLINYQNVEVKALTIQPDGKMLVLVSTARYANPEAMFMYRFNSNGSPDTSFGSGGVVTTLITDGANISTAYYNDIVVQNDGKIVMGGSSSDPYDYMGDVYPSFRRYKPNGSVDSGFGNNGLDNIKQVKGGSNIYNMRVQPDGKIVAVGYNMPHNVDPISDSSAMVVRIKQDGTLDTGFASSPSSSTPGIVLLNPTQSLDYARSMVLDYDGKPVFVLRSSDGLTPDRLVRLNQNGSLDTSFGAGGYSTSVPNLSMNDLDIRENGGLVVAGSYGRYPEQLFAVAKFNGALLPGRFEDVPPSNPFYTYIECMGAQDIISGYTCGGPGEPCSELNRGYFRPNNSMSRGQVSKIVANASGYGETPTTQTFEDVPPGSPFYLYVERMASRNIISGYTCGGPGEPCVSPNKRPYFRPNSQVSRGQLTKIVSNARGYSDTPTTQTFNDVKPSDAFYVYVERLASRGIMSGYGCGAAGEPCPGSYFRPGNNVTRGQASKIVANAYFPNCQTTAPAANK